MNKPPVFTSVPDSLVVNEGEQLQLEAAALGKPVPHISWKRRMENMEDGVLETVEEDQWKTTSQLNKTIALDDESDEWFIQADNSVGSVQHQIGIKGEKQFSI